MGDTKGGVDCTKLIGLILVEYGVLKRVEPVYYGRDWFVHGSAENVFMSFHRHLLLYLRRPVKYLQLKFDERTQLMTGDCLLITTSKRGLCNHTALVTAPGKILHAIERQGGVQEIDFTEYWRDKTRAVFRLYDD